MVVGRNFWMASVEVKTGITCLHRIYITNSGLLNSSAVTCALQMIRSDFKRVYVWVLFFLYRNRFVIVNSRFRKRLQKRSRGNQLIHRRLTRTKSTCSGSDPESQAGGYAGWCFGVEIRTSYRQEDESG